MRNRTLWVGGLRLRTVPASLAPVLVGASSAWGRLTHDGVRSLQCPADAGTCDGSAWYGAAGAIPRFAAMLALCLAVALFLQFAVNFANDYSDGIRGADAGRGDDENRSGKPQRLTASGLVRPGSVLAAAGVCALLACLCGLAVVIITGQYWLIGVGVLCVLAGWYYTGGKHPYGYAGWGELSVFVFFGLVATLGTEFVICRAFDSTVVLHGRFGIDFVGVVAAVCSGLYSVIILMVNNLRDVEEDAASGKRTLAVKVDAGAARVLLLAGIVVALVLALVLAVRIWTPWGAIVWLPLIAASLATMSAIRSRNFGRSLGSAGRQLLVFTLVVVVCTALSNL